MLTIEHDKDIYADRISESDGLTNTITRVAGAATNISGNIIQSQQGLEIMNNMGTWIAGPEAYDSKACSSDDG